MENTSSSADLEPSIQSASLCHGISIMTGVRKQHLPFELTLCLPPRLSPSCVPLHVIRCSQDQGEVTTQSPPSHPLDHSLGPPGPHASLHKQPKLTFRIQHRPILESGQPINVRHGQETSVFRGPEAWGEKGKVAPSPPHSSTEL